MDIITKIYIKELLASKELAGIIAEEICDDSDYKDYNAVLDGFMNSKGLEEWR